VAVHFEKLSEGQEWEEFIQKCPLVHKEILEKVSLLEEKRNAMKYSEDNISQMLNCIL